MIDIKAIREAAEAANKHDELSLEQLVEYLNIASTDAVIALCDEVERLRKDAARYQWLTYDHPDVETRRVLSAIASCLCLRGKGVTDASIDAAMENK